ncbi:MAG: hypothetical protein KDB23_28385 [Planctomycetales bacterium]|nr:hypothetical protein [Planctomycetales bacterium]
MIADALQRNWHKRSKTAEELGMGRVTLHNKLMKLGMFEEWWYETLDSGARLSLARMRASIRSDVRSPRGRFCGFLRAEQQAK